MPQSLAKVITHIVFSTKNRKPYLIDAGLRSDLYKYMSTVMKNEVDSPAILIGGVEDHLYVLCLLSRNFAIKEVLQSMKTETSKWLKKASASTRDFAWQQGYGIFSVSQSNVPEVKSYISNQEQHHRKISFKDEFRIMCRKHDISIDERYVWD